MMDKGWASGFEMNGLFPKLVALRYFAKSYR